MLLININHKSFTTDKHTNLINTNVVITNIVIAQGKIIIVNKNGEQSIYFNMLIIIIVLGFDESDD